MKSSVHLFFPLIFAFWLSLLISIPLNSVAKQKGIKKVELVMNCDQNVIMVTENTTHMGTHFCYLFPTRIN